MLFFSLISQRGSCEPVLISWIDRNWVRQTVVLGVAHETGKAAEDSADNVRQHLASLGITELMNKMADSVDDSKAYKHYCTAMDEYTASFDDHFKSIGKKGVDPKAAALASYMFGAGTADGAIRGLMEKLTGANNKEAELKGEDLTTTHWCTAHRISLVARFSFTQKNQSHIKNMDLVTQLAMKDLYQKLLDVVHYYALESNFNELEVLAKDMNTNHRPHRMNQPTETRFNSYADLIVDVHHNFTFFRELLDRNKAPLPVAALYNPSAIGYQENNIAKTIAYVPTIEIGKLVILGRCLARLCTMSEGDEQDPLLFELELSRFVRQLDGANPLRYIVNGKEVVSNISDLCSGSIVVKGVAAAANAAIGYYFDAHIFNDWALLLCLILHPCCSGRPVTGGVPWPCLKGRFRHAWQDSMPEFTEAKTHEMIMEVMAAGEKTLKEELELQYDIDNSGSNSTNTDESVQDEEEMPPSPKKACISNDDLLDDDDHHVPATAAPEENRRHEAVKTELARWLTRPPDRDTNKTMLSFWKSEPDSMLRRVAMRVGAFLISQCATERVNKIPKEVWSNDRMRLSTTSMARDVFLYANLDRVPSPEFDWEKLGGTE